MDRLHATILVKKTKIMAGKGVHCMKNNRVLINRGNLTLCLNGEKWYARCPLKRNRGHPFVYSNHCIRSALALRAVCHLPLRATQGFPRRTCQVNERPHGLDVLHYSSRSKRVKTLKINISHKAKANGATDIAIDSTGLKIRLFSKICG